MRSKKSIQLPTAGELESNKLEDIRDFMRKILDELDKQWQLLHQDVETIQVDSDEFIYFGGKDTLGTFRLGRSGADWILEHQTTTIGTWVRIRTTKGS